VAITMLFGGVNPLTMVRAMGATLLAVLYTSAFSIYFSVTTRSPLGAVVRTYWWLGFWMLLVPALTIITADGLMRGTGPRSMDLVMSTLCMINPLGSFTAAVIDEFTRNLQRIMGPWFFWLMFLVPILWAVLLLWRAVRLVRRDPVPGKWWPRIKRLLRWCFGWALRGSHSGRLRWLSRFQDPERAWFFVPVRNPFWLRARRVFVYDREGHFRRIQLAFWFFAVLFLILFAWFDPRELRDDDLPMVFFGFSWVGLACLGGLLAGYSIMGERRRGFFELVLTTPLGPLDIIWGIFLTVWRHISVLYLLILAMGLFSMLVTRDAWPGRILASLFTGTLFICLFVYHGLACSLAARTMPGALIGTFALPLLMGIGTLIIMGLAHSAAGPIVWWVCLLCCPVAWFLVSRKLSLPRVTFYLLMVHLGLVALFTSWTYRDVRYYEFPMAAMNPMFMTLATLDKHTWTREYRSNYPNWVSVLVCYWAAVGLNLVWLHFWLCRHFGRLAGRTEGQTSQEIMKSRHTFNTSPPQVIRSPSAGIPVQ
jgi:hypothetical protein